MKQTKLKRKRAPGQSASPKATLLRVRYSILRILQHPFLAGFWNLEQRMERLQEKLTEQETGR